VGDASSRGAAPFTGEFGPSALELRRIAHRTLAAVTDDLSSLRFNRAIARIYELSNALSTALAIANPSADLAFTIREAGNFLVLMFAPMMPHLAEECWRLMGHKQPVVVPVPHLPSLWMMKSQSQFRSMGSDEIKLQKGTNKTARRHEA
jgi:leucyl-tRNA synthetase